MEISNSLNIAENVTGKRLSEQNLDESMPLKQLCLPGRKSIEKYPEYFSEKLTPVSNIRLADSKKYSGVYPDYQFLDQRLVDIYEEEKKLASERAEIECRITEQSDEASKKQLQAELSSGKLSLSPERVAEKMILEASSFITWEQKDFNAFLEATLRNGRTNKDAIVTQTAEITGKSLEEVQRYFDTFWCMYTGIIGYASILEKIEMAESALGRKSQIESAIASKVLRHADNLQGFSLSYGMSKGKLYTDEEDAFLVYMMHKHGYGSWEKIRLEIKNSWLFQFDWFFKSRNTAEIQRRCDNLLRLIEKENEKLAASITGERSTTV